LDWDVVETRLVRRDSWLADVVELAEREGYRTGIWQMDGAPFISLPNAEDKKRAIADFFGSSRKHLRQELDRRLRRLRELGEVEFIVTPGCSAQLLKTYFDLEARGWKGRGGTAVTDDPNVVRLHEDFANEVAARNALFVYELRFNGTTIAMSMNIRDGDTMIHWKTSYDEEYSRYAPGNLLFRQLLSDCIQDGLSEIDFLSPSTPNKRTWATGERDHVAFYIFRRGFLGSLLWAWKFRVVGGLRSLRSRTTSGLQPAHAHK
jgi:CelD/BcsL family acetyltransferase involved in cellulose biosynthesis